MSRGGRRPALFVSFLFVYLDLPPLTVTSEGGLTDEDLDQWRSHYSSSLPLAHAPPTLPPRSPIPLSLRLSHERSNRLLHRLVGEVLAHRWINVFIARRRGALLIHPFLDVGTVVRLSISHEQDRVSHQLMYRRWGNGREERG